MRTVKGRSGQGVCRAQAQPTKIRVDRHAGYAVQAAGSSRANLPHAKMRRSDIATQAKRHKLLLLAEQPLAIECAASNTLVFVHAW
jgi:hypothetical protein